MPKKVDPIERRKLFAEAAISVIAEKGLENLRLVDIAREAGLTTGSLTHYFNDKDQVVAAALDHVIETALAQANSTEDGLIPALLAVLHASPVLRGVRRGPREDTEQHPGSQKPHT